LNFNHGIPFEICDAWLITAGALGVRLSGEAFAASSDPAWPTQIVPLAEVAAPLREGGVISFVDWRMTRVLRAMMQGVSLPPLIADTLAQPNRFRYRVCAGFHRFYASAALGLPAVPLSFCPYFGD